MTHDMAVHRSCWSDENLATRKAKTNAAGVVGLVENMPRECERLKEKPYSGKTIEILNIDAEGRLVLADALTFTEKI